MISFVVVADVVDVVADVVVVAVDDTVSADHITIALIMPGKRTCGKWTPDLGPLATRNSEHCSNHARQTHMWQMDPGALTTCHQKFRARES